MNKNVIWGIVVGVFVILLAGYGWMNRGASDPLDDGDDVATTTAGSFRSLLAMPGSQMCEFSQVGEGNEATGTVYIADGMMRGDFNIIMNGTASLGHMIVKDDQVFVWLDGGALAMKMMMTAVASTKSGPNQNPLNLDQENVSYDCDPWSKDTSKFDEPNNIQFTDLSALVGGSAGASSGGNAGANAPQCAVCEQMAEPQKGQCRLALKCS